MKSYFFPFLFLIGITNFLFSQEKLIINTYNRQQTSLNGYWKYIVDPYENGFYNYRYEAFDKQEKPGRAAYFTNSKRKNKSDLIEYDFDKMDSLRVPGDWNTQKEKLFYYEGSTWYKKSFDYIKSESKNRVFVYFEAANYKADVYLNGEKLGTHVGGFTPFNFELTKLLKNEDNFLIVKIDNKREKDAVPTLNTDWWNYGGITRGVKLIETPPNFIEDYFIQLNSEDNEEINISGNLNGVSKNKQKVSVDIPELGITKHFVTNKDGSFSGSIRSKNIKYWSINTPYLYTVNIATTKDAITDQIGFRTIATKGADILLNGESIFLKGISIHEESLSSKGRAHSVNDAKELLQTVKKLGCNYVRLAHYPHNEHMLRLADQMGILVWEENPVYWTISWENQQTYKNANNQLSEVISRDKNRASVIIWSMANETPTSAERYVFLKKLADFTRKKDPTRLISAALEQSNFEGNPLIKTIHDDFANVVDILSFNQYVGWYDGGIEKCKTIKWKIDYDKPVLISEFGAGAKFGLHGDKETRWTEEYQEYLYTETLKMLDQIEQFRGASPWILADFRSPRRVLPEIQDGWNRKGVVSEKGEKKKAFFVLKNYYNNK